MIRSSYTALTVMLIQVILSSSAGEMPPYWAIRKEYTVGAVIKGMETRNMYQCQHLCWVTPECASVSFATDTRLCSLMSDVPASTDVGPSRTHITSSAPKSSETEWTSPCRLYSCTDGELCVSNQGNYMCLEHEVKCQTPPSIDNADVDYSDTILNSTASYTCHVGFSFQGSSEVNRCDENGQWSGLSGECAVVSCGSPDQLTNGAVTYGTVTYLSTAQYSCLVGYNFVGSSKDSTCDENGSWTGFSGTCQIVSCSTPAPLDYAVETYTTLTYGSTVTYNCNPGFNFLGSSNTATCGASGTWEGLDGVCVGYCAPPVNILNADVTYTLNVDGTAEYTCNDGYIFSGSSSVATCGSNLQWSGLSGSCQVIICSIPDDKPDATKAYTALTYGSTTTYTCDAGYEFSGSSNKSTCDETANWSGFQGSCAYVPVCSTPADLVNAVVTYSSLRVGSVATYTCDTGYNFAGSSNVATCDSSLSWSGPDGTCTVVTCSSAPTLLNSAQINIGSNNYGSTVTFLCYAGFQFTGSSNVATCDENGVWAGLSGSCDTVTLCPDPPSLDNADVAYLLKTVNSVTTYTCHVGYNFQGSSNVATCGTNYQWNGLNGVCEGITCAAPGARPKSQVSQTGLTYGSTATYTCDAGYEFTGSSNQASCDVTGSWSGFSGSCTIVSCPSATIIPNADVAFTTLTFGSTLTYTCREGHRFSDNSQTASVTCQADGSWSSNPGACHIISCGVPPDLENAVVTYSSVTYGAGAAYNCQTGYVFDGSSDTASCNAQKAWEGLSGSCKIVTCPNPPDDPNGDVDFTSKTYASFAQYTCHEGFHFRGIGETTTIRCRANGQWSSLSANCEYIRDCKDLYDVDGSLGDGVYTINPGDNGLVEVYCDMDNGGWTVFQRRKDGSVNFENKWGTYKKGFGSLDGEFWLGNTYINQITTQRTYTLRVDMIGSSRYFYADYSYFKVLDESEKFKLKVGGYSGTAGDSFAYHHNDNYFSAQDRDNDNRWYSCSDRYHGGWWYNACHRANLNGRYGSTSYAEGLNWQSLTGFSYSLSYTAMKIRPT